MRVHMTMIAKRNTAILLLFACWTAVSIGAIFLRPLWPVDETRYVSVAWDMWLRGDFLVPHLNGEPYSHKPPLLFWLMHAGWAMFGVNDWWPRLISPLLALACVPLLKQLANRLWPDLPAVGEWSIWALFGTLLFALFITLTMFDMLLACIVLLGMLAVVQAAQGERRGLIWLGVAIGLGILAKGPVTLLHVLPAALVAPWWQVSLRSEPRRWYLGLLAALLLGAVIGLAWALPAAYFGGEVYRRAILWGQTAGRITESFAHRAPWWHYLPLLPVLLFPWLVCPTFWRGLRRQWADKGVRFILAWLIPVFVGFSLISGKQAKYLVPLMPGFALLAGFALSRAEAAQERIATVWPAFAYLAAGVALFYVPTNLQRFSLPDWASTLPQWPGFVLFAIAASLLPAARAPLQTGVRVLTFATWGLFTVALLGLVRPMVPYYDPGPTAQYLAALQARGVPVAYWGGYHAQFNFAGRLRQPLVILDDQSAPPWLLSHPTGRVVMMVRAEERAAHSAPEYEQPLRGFWVQVWDASAVPSFWFSR